MKKKTLLGQMAAAPHIVWSVLFIIAPLIFVAYYALTDAEGGFTLANFAALFTAEYLEIFMRSACFAFLATVICLVIAYPVAYFISRASQKTQKILIVLVMLPQWMNFLIRTYSWMAILEDTGIINTVLGWVGIGPVHMINTAGAVVLGMVYNFLPYMILPIYTSLSKLDTRYVEASADLGCNSFETLMKVILPLSSSGVISGITMVFVPSVSTFYISQKLGGGNFDLIGDTIERQFMSALNYNLGATLSFVLMVLIIVSMTIMNRFGEEEGGVVA